MRELLLRPSPRQARRPHVAAEALEDRLHPPILRRLSQCDQNQSSKVRGMLDARARVDELSKRKLDRVQRVAVRGALKKLPSLLGEGEEALTLAQGQFEGSLALIAVTDRRVIFVRQSLGSSRVEDFPYRSISSVETSASWMSGALTVFASGNKALIKEIFPKERADEIADQVRRRLSSIEHGSSAAAPSPAGADPYEQLRKLGELRHAGVLSPQEFDAKKAQLLARL